MVNTIYWATDDPQRPRSYDHGTLVRKGAPGSGDLLMIPGPFGLRWAGRLIPRLETGEFAHQDLPSAYRVQRWIELAPRIGTDIFIKLYSHGAQERNSSTCCRARSTGCLRCWRPPAADGGHDLRYVSTWGMRQAVDAATGPSGE